MRKTPGRILIDLTKSQRSELYRPLCEFVEWLLAQKNSDAVLRFRAERQTVEREVEGKVQSGELDATAALSKKADWVWWTALDETANAELFIALKRILERELLAHFKEQLPTDTRQLEDLAAEAEQEIVAKLEEILLNATAI